MDATVGVLSGLGALLLGVVGVLVAQRVRDQNAGREEGTLVTTVQNLQDRVTRLEAAQDKSQDTLANLSQHFGRLEARFEGFEARMGDRLDGISGDLSQVRNLLDQISARGLS